MPFTPANLDGPAGAERMLGFGTYTPGGMCLEAVWVAMRAPTSDAPGQYLLARNNWERAPESRKHHGDRNPPKGAILHFANPYSASAAGHICISDGDGFAASTDQPSALRTGRVSISRIEGSWGGRVYLGWTDWLGGHNITNLGADVAPVIPAEVSALIDWVNEMSAPVLALTYLADDGNAARALVGPAGIQILGPDDQRQAQVVADIFQGGKLDQFTVHGHNVNYYNRLVRDQLAAAAAGGFKPVELANAAGPATAD
jgi:hypothetical protein